MTSAISFSQIVYLLFNGDKIQVRPTFRMPLNQTMHFGIGLIFLVIILFLTVTRIFLILVWSYVFLPSIEQF